eukprot:TRINITY_DN8947_c1_g2_i1.p1 TRINITY_DN8947_c1_g2~~TRINITY_DN8947_c1_g2_i1.p1  ORF type:complete len:452 (+),score=94.95 TRINITY_DN8947_c1_g2_i1:514-1869(+)
MGCGASQTKDEPAAHSPAKKGQDQHAKSPQDKQGPAGADAAGSSAVATTSPAPAASEQAEKPVKAKKEAKTDMKKPKTAAEWKAFRDRLSKETKVVPRAERLPGEFVNIRVFISSTFVDEHGERDILVKKVFNELNTRLRSRFIQVVPLDLRWGVSQEETSVIQQTCLNEIDHCRVHPDEAPWFIGLRGERYGWVQEKYDTPDQFEEEDNYEWLKVLDTREQVSITSLEVYHATVGARFSADSYKGPHSFIYYRDPSFKAEVPEDFRWLFDFEFLDEDAMVREEVQYQYTKTSKYQGYFDDLEDLNKILKASPDVAKFRTYHPTFGEKGDGSKVEKTGQLPTGKMFGCGWTGNLAEFAKQVLEDLYEQINKEYPPMKDLDPLALERAQHRAVVRYRSEGFLGRRDVLERMHKFCTSADKHKEPLVLWGDPGSGKSAVLAQFAREYQDVCGQ